MSKYLKVIILALLVTVMAIGTTYAGQTFVNRGAANTPYSVSFETANNNNDVIFATRGAINNGGAGAAGAAVNAAAIFILNQSLSLGSLMQIQFTGPAAFNGNPMSICAFNHDVVNSSADGVPIATFTPGVGSQNVITQLSTPTGAGNANLLLQAGQAVWLMSGGNCPGTLAGGTYNFPLRVLSTSSPTTGTLKFSVLSSGGVELDGSTAQNIVRVRRAFGAINTINTTHTIDYLAAGANGAYVINAAGAPNITADSRAADATAAGNQIEIYYQANDYTLANGNVTVGANIALQDSANWQGITSVYMMNINQAKCASANAAAIQSNPSGGLNLSVTGSNNNNLFGGSAAGSNAFYMCAQSKGNESLVPRTITALTTITSSSGQSPFASATSTIQTYNPNAYQGIIPWVVNYSGMRTFCLLSNVGNAAANATLDILSNEGTSATVTNRQLGTINAKQSKLIIFNGTLVTDEPGATLADLSGLPAMSRYSARVTIGTSGNSAIITCNQEDPAGSKRIVPVLTNFNQTNWQQ